MGKHTYIHAHIYMCMSWTSSICVGTFVATLTLTHAYVFTEKRGGWRREREQKYIYAHVCMCTQKHKHTHMHKEVSHTCHSNPDATAILYQNMRYGYIYTCHDVMTKKPFPNAQRRLICAIVYTATSRT